MHEPMCYVCDKCVSFGHEDNWDRIGIVKIYGVPRNWSGSVSSLVCQVWQLYIIFCLHW